MMKYVLLASVVFLSACGSKEEIAVEPIVEVRTIEVQRPAPIVPSVDQLTLRPIDWIIITPENAEEKFAQITNGELVLFAVTSQGYENMSLNLSDIRSMIQQQQRIISIYENQFR